ncbi:MULTISPECIES: DMT family transporter [Microvirga]|uniref:DMT family transporter n=1 Tax=Microvirga TaxID=186650 RepID=UPI001FFCF1DA|nr:MULTISPECIES: DMT family transporter [unclassified Microvirga]
MKPHALAKVAQAQMSPPPSVSAVADCPSITEAVAAKAGARSGVPAKDATFAAIGLALLSTVFFATGDVTAKVLTDTLPAIEVTWLRYVVFCLVVVPTVLVTRGTRAMHTPPRRLQIIRALAVAGSSVLFILGLGHLQVAEATAINFISPIFITALSIPLLGEKVGIRRWAAAAVGFLGVMLVVQPGGSAFQMAALLPIGAALSWAVAAITTRLMSSERPEATLAWSAAIGLIALTAFVPFHWRTPTAAEVGLAVLMGGFSTMGHWLIILAYRKAAVSTIAPFSYVQLLFAGLLGFGVFGTVPGAMTLVGGLVIAASGLYTAHRERIRAREARLAVAGSRP